MFEERFQFGKFGFEGRDVLDDVVELEGERPGQTSSHFGVELETFEVLGRDLLDEIRQQVLFAVTALAGAERF